MKIIIFVIFLLFQFQFAISQPISVSSVTGHYFVDKPSQKVLMICEDAKWYYTNCSVPQTPIHEECNNCDSILVEVVGTYHIKDSLLYLKNRTGSTTFILKVVDTLNLQIVFTAGIYYQGMYFNRMADFYPGFTCVPVFYLDYLEFCRWIIGDDELLRFSSLGFIFRSKYTVEKLQPGYWKRNEIQK